MFYPSGEESVKRTEWGKTSPSVDDQWCRASVSHSDDWAMSTTWDMQLDSTGEEGCRLEPVE